QPYALHTILHLIYSLAIPAQMFSDRRDEKKRLMWLRSFRSTRKHRPPALAADPGNCRADRVLNSTANCSPLLSPGRSRSQDSLGVPCTKSVALEEMGKDATSEKQNARRADAGVRFARENEPTAFSESQMQPAKSWRPLPVAKKASPC